MDFMGELEEGGDKIRRDHVGVDSVEGENMG